MKVGNSRSRPAPSLIEVYMLNLSAQSANAVRPVNRFAQEKRLDIDVTGIWVD